MNDADNIIKHLVDLKTFLEEGAHGRIDDTVRYIDDLKEEIRTLRFRLSQFYRRKSEKVSANQVAMAFLLETTVPSNEVTENKEGQAQNAQGNKADAQDDAETKSDKPKRKKRKSNIELLRKEIKEVYPSDEQLRCEEHGDSMQEIDVVVRRQIVYKPAEVYVLEEHVHVFECAPCGYDNPVTGPVTPKLIENGLPSSSLLSHIVTAKVVDSTPLERVARQLSRHGANIATARLYDWFGQVGDAVDGFGRHAHSDLLTSSHISLDDTPYVFKLLNGEGPKKGRLWLYIGDYDRVAFCQFTEDWKGGHPQEVLRGFDGLIQNDGYGGIDALFGRPGGPIRAGCSDHARRKVVAAVQAGDERARPLLALFQTLYRIERKAQATGCDFEQRRALRILEAKPVWEQIDKLRMDLAETVGKKTLLGKALTYLDRQRQALTTYLEHGCLNIANAHVERMLRVVATTRKSCHYIGSLKAGRQYANLLTLAVNCLLCGANPFDYFRDVIDAIADGLKAKDIPQFMPSQWLLRQAAAIQQA